MGSRSPFAVVRFEIERRSGDRTLTFIYIYLIAILCHKCARNDGTKRIGTGSASILCVNCVVYLHRRELLPQTSAWNRRAYAIYALAIESKSTSRKNKIYQRFDRLPSTVRHIRAKAPSCGALILRQDKHHNTPTVFGAERLHCHCSP